MNNNIIEYIEQHQFIKDMRIIEIENYINHNISIYDLKHFYGEFDEDNEQIIFCLESRLLKDFINMKIKLPNGQNSLYHISNRRFI